MSNIYEKILQYHAKSAAEVALKEQFLQFIGAFNLRAFERSNLTGHLTGSAWVIDPTEKKVLLLYHRKLDKWLQPGGHADGIVDMLTVATKELTEETGLAVRAHSDEIFDLDVHAIPWHKETPPHLHFDVRYLFLASINQELKISEESSDLRWFALEQLEALAVDASVARMSHKTLLLIDNNQL